MAAAAFIRRNMAQLTLTADALAAAVGVSLPWSTSATGILVVLWLLAVVPTFDASNVRQTLMSPSAALPLLLVALGALGMLWADVAVVDRMRSFAPFAKLLVIPLLMIHFSRSERAHWVLLGFLASCTALLAVSLLLVVAPGLFWFKPKALGVPVKDYIAQSGEFVLCAVIAAYLAVDCYRTSRRAVAAGLLLLSTCFLFDVLYIATARTALATIPVLLALFAWRQFGWKGAAGFLVGGVAAAAVIWWSSPYLRDRVMNVPREVEAYQLDRKPTSTGERLEFWKKSAGFLAEAPVLGHGTGSTEAMFKRAVAEETGTWAKPSTNPHNQTLAIGIQLGFVGIALLFAMWGAHLLLFCRGGAAAFLGLLVVVQNVISSLFNSHLFDFTQGWTYVFGVGIAAGQVLRSSKGFSSPLPPEAQASNTLRSGAPAQRPV